MPVALGEKAPEFCLFNSEKNKVCLNEFKGKNVLVLFFPLAFTSVCTRELCAVRDGIAAYNHLNCEVVAISVDSVYTLAKFKADQQLNFTLLSDFNKETSASYDALYESFGFEMKGVSKRAAFLVDKDGITRYKEVLENAGEVPDFNAIKETLSAMV